MYKYTDSDREQTTFWSDFSIADCFGVEAVQNTFDRAFNEWKEQYKYLTELVMVLNHKIYEHYEKNMTLARKYNELFLIAEAYALDNLKGEELEFFVDITD